MTGYFLLKPRKAPAVMADLIAGSPMGPIRSMIRYLFVAASTTSIYDATKAIQKWQSRSENSTRPSSGLPSGRSGFLAGGSGSAVLWCRIGSLAQEGIDHCLAG